MNAIVTTSWLDQHLNAQHLILLDASQPSSITKQENVVEGKFIPGSLPFSLKEFSDQQSDLPNTLPSTDHFQKKSRELGINTDSQIVVYDNAGIYWSPRVWWMFHVMGHKNVAVLDGGLPAWVKEKRPTVDTITNPSREGDFEATLDIGLLKYLSDISLNVKTRDFTVVDARSKGRFDGSSPEPREGLPSGHIPDSLNIPFEQVLNEGFFKSKDELTDIFGSVEENRSLVFSCGSGLTACIVLLAHSLLSDEISPVYDGSWTEWAQSGEPIATNL